MERREIQVDAVFDIEAQDWDRFIAGGLYLASGEFEEFSAIGVKKAEAFQVEAEFASRLITSGMSIWAHFGGGYDFKWLLDWIGPWSVPCQITAASSRIVTLKVGRTKFYDSFALVPMGLAKFSASQGVKKQELKFPCVCGLDCGGYCSIRRDMSKEQRVRLLEYLRADCVSLFSSLHSLATFSEANDLDLGATIGSSAWRNVQRYGIGIDEALLPKSDYDFARLAYFGGRCQVYSIKRFDRLYLYDINSQYPFVMREYLYPVGAARRVYGRGAERAFQSDSLGIYRALVHVPKCHLPPLPIRIMKPQPRIAYPYGTFSGTWTSAELKHARTFGAAIEIQEGIVWSGSDRPFVPWVEKLWDLRANVGKDTPFGKWVKLYLNSLTGKFGMRPEREIFALNPATVSPCRCVCPRCKATPPCDCGAVCSCGALTQISDHVWTGNKYLVRPSGAVGDSCCHIEWAAFLTSYARIELHKQQLSIDPDGRNVIYSDTDSIFSTIPLTRRIGKGLGEWDVEDVYEFEAMAPKCYSYKTKEGTLQTKAKGVRIPKGERPRPNVSYRADDGVIGFKEGTKTGAFFVRKNLTRRLRIQTGDRILNEDLSTSPQNADAFEADQEIAF